MFTWHAKKHEGYGAFLGCREAAVLFVNYLWGKPQLRRRRRMRRGQNSPADKSLKRPGREARPPARRAYAPEGTKEKSHNP